MLLVIEGTYPWYRGGVSEWIYQYIKNCTQFSFSILQIATDTFISLEPEQALYPLPDNIISFERIPPPELKTEWISSLSNWYNNHSDELDLDIEVDLVHVTNTGFAGWLGTKIAESFNLPLVLTEHAVYWLEVEKGAVALECGYKIPESSDGKNSIVSLFKEIAREVYRKAEEVITVSECNIPLQNKLGAKDINYIPNGIPKAWINQEKGCSDIPVIGWVGRCAEMKNPLQFFDFIDEFRKIDFKCKFLMLLSDAGEKKLEERVKKRAERYPSLNMVWDQPSEAYYPKMDMLFITSHNESQPLVMFEALAKKVLPVGRQVGDLTNTYGLTFHPEISNSDLCKEVSQFWFNEEIRNEYLNKRFEKVQLHHTWEHIFLTYQELLTKTLDEHSVTL
ncbi:MAG: DUF3492 domain-containing protein [Balneola sp.]